MGLAGGIVLARLSLATFGDVAGVWIHVAPDAVAVTPALAALAAAVGIYASLVASLERSWLRLLDGHQRSDLVVQGGGPAVSLLTHPPIAESVSHGIRTIDGVAAVQGMRLVETTLADRPAVIEAIDPSPYGLPLVAGRWNEIAERFLAGDGVAVSENLAHRTGLGVGDAVMLATPNGAVRLPVLGVFADIADSGDLGGVAIVRHAFRRLWNDRLESRIRVWTAPGRDPAEVAAAITRRFGTTHGLTVLTFAESRAAVTDLVERAFAISLALATLAGIGVSASQIGGAVVVEGALVGLLGAGLGLLAGALASWAIVLQSVPMINGWRFEHAFPLETALGTVVAAVVLTSVAALAPARLAQRLRSATEGCPE